MEKEREGEGGVFFLKHSKMHKCSGNIYSKTESKALFYLQTNLENRSWSPKLVQTETKSIQLFYNVCIMSLNQWGKHQQQVFSRVLKFFYSRTNKCHSHNQ